MSEAFDTERLRRIEAALRELPYLDRQIFLAMRLDRLSVADIARRTGLSHRQVVLRLGRAISHLGIRLRELDEA
jgi:RNA polymerase sigma-70 factor (ECF subfamily)